MLSFLPKFEVGDFVSCPHYQTSPFLMIGRIESIQTKMLFFHSYTVSRADLESYGNPGMTMDILPTYSQRQLTKLDYNDIVTYFSAMMVAQFGNAKRTGKLWTDIESNILEEVYPKLEELSPNPSSFLIDLQTIFGRSIRAIETQYKKVTNHE